MRRKLGVHARTKHAITDLVLLHIQTLKHVQPKGRVHTRTTALGQPAQQVLTTFGINDNELVNVGHDHMGKVAQQSCRRAVQQTPAFLFELGMRITGNADHIAASGQIGHFLAASMVDDVAVLTAQHFAVIAQPDFQVERVIAHHSQRGGGGLHRVGPCYFGPHYHALRGCGTIDKPMRAHRGRRDAVHLAPRVKKPLQQPFFRHLPHKVALNRDTNWAICIRDQLHDLTDAGGFRDRH